VSSNNKKKLLVISHPFPPVGGPGVQRITKFVKYLPHFGWRAIVLTVDPRIYPIRDGSLTEDIPSDVPVFRIPTPEPRVHWKKNILGQLLFKTVAFFSVPDVSVWWVPWAVWHGYKVMQEQTDAIFVTGSPFSSYFVGAVLKKLTGAPLVIDFRDAWTLHPDEYPPARYWLLRWRNHIERLIEHLVLQCADKVILCTDGMRESFVDHYQCEELFVTIRNGFDPDDFEVEGAVGSLLNESKFNIVYVGNTQSLSSRPDVFLKAIKQVLERETDIARDLGITFVGVVDSQSENLINELRLAQWIKTVGYVSHQESVGYLLEADVLLLIVKEHSSIVTGKIFEYIGARKPVLALVVPDGEAAWLLQKAGSGILADWNDPTDIASKIITLYHRWQARDLTVSVDSAFVATLTRKNMTRLLANVLDKVK
jgi:hypothetical protein